MQRVESGASGVQMNIGKMEFWQEMEGVTQASQRCRDRTVILS